MKKIVLLIGFFVCSDSYSMQDLVQQQMDILQPIVKHYGKLVTPPNVEKFLEPYPDGVSLQRVFSNQQKAALCGVYLLQNALWYYYAVGQQDTKELVEANHTFANLFNRTDSANSPLNGMEVESLEEIVQLVLNDRFAIVAAEGGRYVLKNIVYTDKYERLSDYMKKMITEQRVPIISFFMAYSAGNFGSTYDPGNPMNGIGAHWVSLTMVQNEQKRVYLMADSLLGDIKDPTESHLGFVKNLIKLFEEKYGYGDTITMVDKSTNADYQIPSNDENNKHLRNEWLYGSLRESLKQRFEKHLKENKVDESSKEFVLANYFDPLLQTFVSNDLEDLYSLLLDKENKSFKGFALIESELKENIEYIQHALLSAFLELQDNEKVRVWKDELEKKLSLSYMPEVVRSKQSLGIRSHRRVQSPYVPSEEVVDQVD